MSKQRTAHAYELELKKMIKARTGAECEPWLLPQIRATANNEVMIEKIQRELEECSSLITPTVGSTGQVKNEVNPLLVQYDKAQRTLLLQFEALGLNYKTTPKKVTENTKKGGTEQNKLAALLSDLNDYPKKDE